MAILTFLVADTVGGSGFIAAFIGGLALGYIVKDAGKILIDFLRGRRTTLKFGSIFPFRNCSASPAI